MSEPKCPGCGANVREEHFSYRRFECMTLELDELGLIGAELRESADCLRRQLAQRDERIGELEEQLHLPCVICGLAHSPGRYNGPEGSGWAECYERRRAERLDAEIVELRRAINGVAPTDPKRFEDLDLCVALNNHADLATVAPVVRAAMEQEDHHSDAARHYPHDPRDLCACGVCVQVRSLPADVRERMGVDRG